MSSRVNFNMAPFIDNKPKAEVTQQQKGKFSILVMKPPPKALDEAGSRRS